MLSASLNKIFVSFLLFSVIVNEYCFLLFFLSNCEWIMFPSFLLVLFTFWSKHPKTNLLRSAKPVTACNNITHRIHHTCPDCVYLTNRFLLFSSWDPLSYFPLQPVLNNWCNIGHSMCYPVSGNPLLLIERVAHVMAAAYFLSHCPSGHLPNETFPSFRVQ